jgi:hypothetical protein
MCAFCTKNYEVIPEAIISIKGVTVILFGLGRIVNHLLVGWLSALLDHFPGQITARLPIYEREDVDPVFFIANKSEGSVLAPTMHTAIPL